MQSGSITQYIDVAQLVLYAFWIFFGGLIYYLLQENKREGYPLESDIAARTNAQGWPPLPKPKTYRLADGTTRTAPSYQRSEQPIAAVPTAKWPGAPLRPTGNPMLDGVGPGAYANRPDKPDLTVEGQPKIVPLRAAPGFEVAKKDPDPRGLPVTGADGKTAGNVLDLWVDRSEMLFRYLELGVATPDGERRVLLPVNFCRITHKGIKVKSILASQFAQVPATRLADQVTLLEEEKITAYYGGGKLYAEPSRQEPLI